MVRERRGGGDVRKEDGGMVDVREGRIGGG